MNTEAMTVLRTGATQLGAVLSDHDAAQMLEYLVLLNHWNRAYNLTGVTDPALQITHHLLDSLSVLSWLSGGRIVDVGTGAGLPGIPLAIADPHRHYTLIDATAKKTRFLRHVARTLSLQNVEIVTARVEDYQPMTGFDTVVARALAALPKLIELSGALIAPGGILLAMKGRDPVEETREMAKPWGVRGIHRLHVPGLEAERHLVVIEKN